MKIVIVFIITHFILIAFCTENDNSTSTQSNEFCSVNYNRKKRNTDKYTLWRSDDETSPFIVKVLDEEATTPNIRSIVGINIHPNTRNMPKIILGAPIIPRHTTRFENDAKNDYTRFMKSKDGSETDIDIIDLKEIPKILLDKINDIRPTDPRTIIGTRTPLITSQVPPVITTLNSKPQNQRFNKLSKPNKYFPNKNYKDDVNNYDIPITRTILNSNPYRTSLKPTPTLTEKSNKIKSELWFYADEVEEDDEKIFEDISTSNPITEYYDEKEHITVTKNIRKYFDDAVKTTINTIPTFNETLHESSNNACCLTKLRPGKFDSPRTLPEIVAQLRKWAEESPIAKWIDITYSNLTAMNNPIYMMIVDDPSSGQIASAKQIVMIVAGIQGKDHHAVTAAMYILYQLIDRSESNSVLLKRYRFWIIPVFNPDGYDYSITFPQRRQWSKNLRQSWEDCKGRKFCTECTDFGIGCTLRHCYGVNLDRNFEYQWMVSQDLKMKDPCAPLYSGPRQLSEPETLALTKYTEESNTKIFTFLALKEGDVLGVMYPHSHTKKKRASDYIYRHRATRAAAAAYSINGRSYVSGQTSEFLPLYAGGIEEWMEGHLGVDNTYTIMMYRPTDFYNNKLHIERIIHEAFAAMDTLLLQSMSDPPPPPSTLVRAHIRRRSDTSKKMPMTLQVLLPFAVFILLL